MFVYSSCVSQLSKVIGYAGKLYYFVSLFFVLGSWIPNRLQVCNRALLIEEQLGNSICNKKVLQCVKKSFTYH